VTPLLAEVARLPRSIEPPSDLWRPISTRIGEQKVVTGVFGSARRPWWTRGPSLAAAAAALVVLSSTVTMLVVRRTGVAPAASAMLSSDFISLEAQYALAAEEIVVALAQGEVGMTEGTRRVLERNLRVIDNAINESRAALARDPANQELKDMVLTVYQHKLDLLRRATTPSAL
jgi:hypothetical protein